MKHGFGALAAFVVLLAARAPVLAHHGQAAYDNSAIVTVTGKVTEFQFVNPHCIVYFEGAPVGTQPSGEAERWQGELTSPNHLIRAGWTSHSLKPGDQIVLTGWRAKNGSNSLWITKTVVNGQELKTAMGT